MVTPISPATADSVESPANLHELGRVRILEALAQTGRLSRPDLIRRTGLARATVGSLLNDLVLAGIVTELEPAPRDRGQVSGRPARTLMLSPDAAYAVGLDIAHDRVRCMLCDLAGQPIWDKHVTVAVDDAPDAALDLATSLITQAAGRVPAERILGVGVGIACPVDQRTGTLHAAGIMPGWVRVRPIDELTARTGFAVRLINDANAAVLAESRYGAAQHQRDCVYLRMSSGIGAGIICDGRMLLGCDGLTGELGHIPVDPNGAICRCGNRGCLETVATPEAIAGLLSRSWHRPVATTELIPLIESGNTGAIRAFADAADAVGRAVSAAVMLLNPGQVVVGGELAAAGQALFEPMSRSIQRNTMGSHARGLEVISGALGDSAGVRGAAALVLADAPQYLAGVPAAGGSAAHDRGTHLTTSMVVSRAARTASSATRRG